MGTESFPGIKWLEPVVDHPLLSNAEVKEKEDLHLPVWAFLVCSRVTYTLLTFILSGLLLAGYVYCAIDSRR
jgi:hypothetical protein